MVEWICLSCLLDVGAIFYGKSSLELSLAPLCSRYAQLGRGTREAVEPMWSRTIVSIGGIHVEPSVTLLCSLYTQPGPAIFFIFNLYNLPSPIIHIAIRFLVFPYIYILISVEMYTLIYNLFLIKKHTHILMFATCLQHLWTWQYKFADVAFRHIPGFLDQKHSFSQNCLWISESQVLFDLAVS